MPDEFIPGQHSSRGAEWLDYVPAKYRASVADAFSGTPNIETSTEDLVAYRYWGDGSAESGSPWFSAKPYVKPGNARRFLALPEKNSAQNMTQFVIRAGSTIIRGKAASQAGVPGFGDYAVGGGVQIYVPEPEIAQPIR